MFVHLEIILRILAGINFVHSVIFQEKSQNVCLENLSRSCNCTNKYDNDNYRYKFTCFGVNSTTVMDLEYINEERLYVHCKNISSLEEFPDLTEHINVTEIDLQNCPVSMNRSLYDYTSKISMKMNKLKLFIGDNDEDRNFNANYFEGLSSLESFHLTVLQRIEFRLPLENVFEKLVDLKNLTIRDLITPNGIFDTLEQLQNLEIHNYFLKPRSLQFGVFKNQRNLTFLRVMGYSFNSIESDIFANLIELESFILSETMLKSIPDNMLEHNRMLISFELTNNVKNIKTLPHKLLANMWNLKYIKLYYNNLEYLPEDLFENSLHIKSILISDNKLSALPKDIFMEKINLELLDLSRNILKDLIDGLFDSLVSLKDLYLSDNKLSNISK